MKENLRRGLYTPELEHDACGIGCIANIDGSKSHDILSDALSMLENMEHRGGRGCNPKTGDGAGVLIQIPHKLFAQECDKLGFALPDAGQYGVGMVFFPRDKKVTEACRKVLLTQIKALGLELIGFRVVPADHSVPSPCAAGVEPHFEQVIVISTDSTCTSDAFER